MTRWCSTRQGRNKLRYEFEPTGKPDIANGKGAPGRAQLYFDGKLVGNAEFEMTAPLIFGIEGLSCGYDFGEAVTHDYHAPFRTHIFFAKKRWVS